MLFQFDIPAASLTTISGTVQEIVIPTNVPVVGGRLMRLQNMQVNVEGSNIVIHSDVEVSGITSSNATVTFQPYVANGSVVIRDLDINVTTGLALSLLIKPAIKIFQATIASRINTLIQNTLAGKVAITRLDVGPTIRVTCVRRTIS
ncbi:MAG: hypothetical protein JO123_09460 [Ktedonobacteraceae bacterium]|nr:hypothetical protein [Ktedonobacteraceae bacterium]